MDRADTSEKPRWPWFNWLILAFFFLLGPMLMTQVVFEASQMMRATGRTTAVVTAVREDRASSSSPPTHCPTLRWSHGEATFEREMPTCLDDAEAVAVGREIALRIDPDDPSVVFMDLSEATTGRVLPAFAFSMFGMIGFAVGARARWRASRPPREAADA